MTPTTDALSFSPGGVVLFGSGEAAPSGGKTLQALAPHWPHPPRLAVLETPAGFELNSAQVAGRVAEFMRVRLQNYAPQVTVIPARARGTAFSPDDPALAQPLLDANLIFLGPGSPTYAVRQLRDSVVWETTRACHRLGTNLVLASAATIAIGTQALPVYEIYKVGEDLHWRAGLNLLGDFGLDLVFVPHWNNNDGGADLDTRRCFMGATRFEQLRARLPAEQVIVGIDEHTALALNLATGTAQVLGLGQVTLLRGASQQIFTAEESFPLTALGPFALPAPEAGLVPAVWAHALAHHTRPREEPPSAEILALLEARQAARTRRDWPAADQIRRELVAAGWDIQDTADGARLVKRP